MEVTCKKCGREWNTMYASQCPKCGEPLKDNIGNEGTAECKHSEEELAQIERERREK